MVDNTHSTWDGKPLRVVYTPAAISPKSHKGDHGRSEANVKRTFEPSAELYAAIFSQETGVFNDKTSPGMTPHQRTSWLHLWDGVCCRSISPAEAYECVQLGYVTEYLKVRASNYMHLV